MNKSIIIIIAMILSIVVVTAMLNLPESSNVINFDEYSEVIIEDVTDNNSEEAVKLNEIDATKSAFVEVSPTLVRGNSGGSSPISSTTPTATATATPTPTEIPEFPIIALPVLTMVGLFFILSKRK